MSTIEKSSQQNDFPTDSDEEDEESSLMWMRPSHKEEEFFNPLRELKNRNIELTNQKMSG